MTSVFTFSESARLIGLKILMQKREVKSVRQSELARVSMLDCMFVSIKELYEYENNNYQGLKPLPKYAYFSILYRLELN